MKLERVSEYQISCTLSGFDLIERDIELNELAYGSKKARRLLREMMQQASSELGFEVDNMPLRVESIPLSDDSIRVLITKVDDPEELDARFSRFVPSTDTEEDEDDQMGFSDFLQDTDEREPSFDDDEMDELLRKCASLANEFTSVKLDEKIPEPSEYLVRGFRFPNLDAVITAAHALQDLSTELVAESLYRNPENGRYTLVLRFKRQFSLHIALLCNSLGEYSEPLLLSPARAAFYDEHYERILSKDVLTSLAKL
ncbi:MAG: adaptor protein MecA [Stomatobaculum longum]